MPPSSSDIEEEQIHFANVIATFQNYTQNSLAANNRRRKDIYALPKADQDLLEKLGYKQKLDDVDNAIVANSDFLSQIVADPEIFGHDLGSEDEQDANDGTPDSQITEATKFDMDKLRSTLKQFVRDWSEEGKEERDNCYKPMEDALLEHFADISPADRGKRRVLVPGAGLGRLAYNVANLGVYPGVATGRTSEINKYTFYPYVHTFSNAIARGDILRPVSIPDVLPSALPPGSNFSLVAGDFEEIYGTDADPDEPQAGQWDAILTCFFIDTAKNIVNYLRIIHKILAPGGVWINLGPLLWHFENNNTNDPSVELDLTEVKDLARAIGFELSNERTIDTTYTSNSAGMLGYTYHAAFWTATKINPQA
ncbi:N2227-like protein-domain-containing protein [Infundibulicybe gibba]|nr:N2227-like protein-domain-containing protein [Infundibulicybe gibba]